MNERRGSNVLELYRERMLDLCRKVRDAEWPLDMAGRRRVLSSSVGASPLELTRMLRQPSFPFSAPAPPPPTKKKKEEEEKKDGT